MIVHDIRVTTNQLIELAEEIRRINERLNDDLNMIEQRLTQTQSLWESEAGNEIRTTMVELKGRFFEQYHTIVNSYADFLEQSAGQYESTENTIKTNATMFK